MRNIIYIILCAFLAGALVWGGINEYQLYELKGDIRAELWEIKDSINGVPSSKQRLAGKSTTSVMVEIRTLQNEIRTLQDEIGTLQDDIETLGQDMSSIKTDLWSIQIRLR